MKQVITLLVVGIFMVSLMGVALASQGDNSVGISVNAMAGQSDDTGNSDNESGDDNSDDKGEGNTTRERIEIKQGEEVETRLRVRAGEGNYTKIQLSNGRNAEIKVMPSVASETALARLRIKVCNESNNCSIELKEVGSGNQTKAAYEVQFERHFRILGMFQTKAEVKTQVNAETGELIRVKKPWWAFLASEPEEN